MAVEGQLHLTTLRAKLCYARQVLPPAAPLRKPTVAAWQKTPGLLGSCRGVNESQKANSTRKALKQCRLLGWDHVSLCPAMTTYMHAARKPGTANRQTDALA